MLIRPSYSISAWHGFKIRAVYTRKELGQGSLRRAAAYFSLRRAEVSLVISFYYFDICAADAFGFRGGA